MPRVVGFPEKQGPHDGVLLEVDQEGHVLGDDILVWRAWITCPSGVGCWRDSGIQHLCRPYLRSEVTSGGVSDFSSLHSFSKKCSVVLI